MPSSGLCRAHGDACVRRIVPVEREDSRLADGGGSYPAADGFRTVQPCPRQHVCAIPHAIYPGGEALEDAVEKGGIETNPFASFRMPSASPSGSKPPGRHTSTPPIGSGAVC